MAVDVGSLTMPEFLMMLNWEGNPPPDEAFDKIRMTRKDWETMFPSAPVKGDQPADGTDPDPAHPAATH